MQLPDSAKKWLDSLIGQRPGTVADKPVRKWGKHQGSKRGFVHMHSPTWQPGLPSIRPALYRHAHLGVKPATLKRLARSRLRQPRTGS